MKRLVFLGPPGSGKGTQAAILAENYQIPHISTGEILRDAVDRATPLGQQARDYMDRGELVPDSLILDLIKERLSQSDARSGWILDGFPRNVNQAAFLEKLLQKLNQSPDCALNLDVTDDTLVTRMLSRGRKDDNEETIRRRLQVYREQTAPVIGFYNDRSLVKSVDGDRLPAEVTEALKQIIAA
jgi:adenylate kinase